ncbi:MAG: flagellar hook-associated protein FlgK [Planctomycetota bacterium]
MGLFGTIQQSAGALNAAQVGLQVVGNNIANANTEGYIRQKLEQTPAVAFRQGGRIQGHGVRVTGINQVIDQTLAERMFNAKTALNGAETLQEAYNQLEGLTSDLDGGGLNEQFSLFNNALHDLSTQPNDTAMREFVVIQGQTLANQLRGSREQATDLQEQWNGQLSQISTQINRLTERIARLNVEIATIEGGGLLGSDATGLRDQRYRDLEELAGYIDINWQEQESGTVSIFVGGDYLVNNRNWREVYPAVNESAGGIEVRIVETDAPLQVKGGTLGAAIEVREGVFGEYIDALDQMAEALIYQLNRVHSQGQGRSGFSSVVASNPSTPGVPIASAGFPFDPGNGSFDLNLVDTDGSVISTNRIDVRNLGQLGDATVLSIAEQITSINGLTASVSSDGRLRIESDSPAAEFTFGEDTSGFLAAAGLNTFFTGSDALDIAVNQTLVNDVDLLAISSGGVGQDTNTLYDMLDLIDKPLDDLDQQSIRSLYSQMQSRLAQETSLQSSSVQGLNDMYATLRSQHLAITGVNIDEESINMISYQRVFQASSRVISAAAEMLEILVNI